MQRYECTWPDFITSNLKGLHPLSMLYVICMYVYSITTLNRYLSIGMKWTIKFIGMAAFIDVSNFYTFETINFQVVILFMFFQSVILLLFEFTRISTKVISSVSCDVFFDWIWTGVCVSNAVLNRCLEYRWNSPPSIFNVLILGGFAVAP